VPFDTPRNWVRERQSVWLTNGVLAAMFGTLVLLLGWDEVLLVHVSIMAVGSILGVWLFSLQHRFETAHWMRRAEWNAAEASLRGSSWLALPRPLHWLTGNIGFHHVHHLNPLVPNYRLSAAHAAVQALCPVPALSLRSGLRAPLLTLWDEATGRLVRFRDARA
jgi:acyl-lipid omega-6 desaturase (Delta-12 desaturase)